MMDHSLQLQVVTLSNKERKSKNQFILHNDVFVQRC